MCGAGSYIIDAFDPLSCVFLPIQARLVDDSSCLLLVDNTQLVVISEEYFTRWSAGQGAELLKKSEVKHAVWIMEHNQAPVVEEESGLIYYGVAGLIQGQWLTI